MLSEQSFAEWYYADNRLGERPDFKELWAFIQRHLDEHRFVDQRGEQRRQEMEERSRQRCRFR